MKKYEFTGETKQISTINGTVTLHRIKASVTFGNIKSGDIGGWIDGIVSEITDYEGV